MPRFTLQKDVCLKLLSRCRDENQSSTEDTKKKITCFLVSLHNCLKVSCFFTCSLCLESLRGNLKSFLLPFPASTKKKKRKLAKGVSQNKLPKKKKATVQVQEESVKQKDRNELVSSSPRSKTKRSPAAKTTVIVFTLFVNIKLFEPSCNRDSQFTHDVVLLVAELFILLTSSHLVPDSLASTTITARSCLFRRLLIIISIANRRTATKLNIESTESTFSPRTSVFLIR